MKLLTKNVQIPKGKLHGIVIIRNYLNLNMILFIYTQKDKTENGNKIVDIFLEYGRVDLIEGK